MIGKYLKDNALFVAGTLLIAFIMWLFYIENGRIEAQLMLNGCHSDTLDQFFVYFTYMGGGLPTYIGIALMLFRVRPGLFILLTQGMGSIITQPIKYTACHARPLTMFTDWDQLQYASNTELHDAFSTYMQSWIETANQLGASIPGGYNSFPSGHTSAVFALMACCAAILPKKYRWWQLAFLVIAIAVAYSRIYLSAHFLDDVISGALVGLVSAIIIYSLLYRKDWGEYNIIEFFREKKWKLNSAKTEE